MYLLGMGDVVIAGQYSSLTQAMALYMSIGVVTANKETGDETISYERIRQGGRFCTAGLSGDVMDCFDTLQDFVLQKPSIPRIGNPEVVINSRPFRNCYISLSLERRSSREL